MLIDVRNAIRQCTSKKQRDLFAELIGKHIDEKDAEIERLQKVVDAVFVWNDADDEPTTDTVKAVAQLAHAVREYRAEKSSPERSSEDE